MPTTRARRREDVTARVLEIGREHLAEHGAAGLSLRAVTRDLGHGVVGGLPLRRQPRRAAHPAARRRLRRPGGCRRRGGRSRRPTSAGTTRVLAAAHAFRAWAVAEPSRYALLYGSPVPGYAAPAEVTNEPGTRVIGVLLSLVAEGVAAGDVPDRPAPHDPPEPLASDLRAVGAEVGLDTHPAVLRRAPAAVVDGGGRHQPRGVRAVRPRHLPRPEPGLRPAGQDGARRAARRPRPALTSAKSGALRGSGGYRPDSAKCS